MSIRIENLYVIPGDPINFYYLINDQVYDARDLELTERTPEELRTQGRQVTPFNLSLNGSEPIMMVLRFSVYTDLMIYQVNDQGRLVEVTPRPRGNTDILAVELIEVPRPNANEEEGEPYSKINLSGVNESLLDQLENLIYEDFPNGITNDVFNRILTIQPRLPPPDDVYLYENQDGELAYYYNGRLYNINTLNGFDSDQTEEFMKNAHKITSVKKLSNYSSLYQPLFMSTTQDENLIVVFHNRKLHRVAGEARLVSFIQRNSLIPFNVPEIYLMNLGQEYGQLPIRTLLSIEEVVEYLLEELLQNNVTVGELLNRNPLVENVYPNVYIELLRKLYSLPPSNFTLPLYSFHEIQEILNKGWIVDFEVDPRLQLWITTPGNTILTLKSRIGRNYYTEVQYDPINKRIYPPLSS